MTDTNLEGSTGSEPRRWKALLAGGLLVAAVLEVGLHVRVSGDGIPAANWQGAAAFIRGEWRDGDVLVVAPSWISPLVRQAVGSGLTASSVAPGSLEGAPRVWAVSARGFVPRALVKDRATVSERFGEVRVERWDRAGEAPKFDFVAKFSEATVSLVRGGSVTPCAVEAGAPEGGGLGRGPVRPGRRYECGGKAERWIAPVTVEDLDYQPRYCVRQPVFGKDTPRIEYADVPLGTKLVFHAGLYLRDERKRKGAPITFRVLINGNAAGEFIHRDGDGWGKYEVSVPPTLVHGAGTVALEVASAGTKDRNLCWTGVSL